MEPVAIILVLFSVLCHAGWNFLVQTFKRPVVAMWLMVGAGLIAYLPIFLFTAGTMALYPALVGLILVSGLTKAGYLILLAVTYERSDFSLGYPLSRTGILLVPVWAYLFLGEEIATTAATGIVAILVGIYILNCGLLRRATLRPARGHLSAGVGAALGTAFLVSVYSVVDKGVVEASGLGPVNFLYMMFLPTFVGLTAHVLTTTELADIKAELQQNLSRITAMGLLNFTGYLAVLVAMQMSKVSYVLALRQLSIVLGAALGTTLLREKYGERRIVGSVVIFVGALLVLISK